jgi:uncharacterized protein YlxW (UPF0749 family)
VRPGAWGCGAAALIGFLGVTAHVNVAPSDVSTRVPERMRLAALIRQEQSRSARLRTTAADLRNQVAAIEATEPERPAVDHGPAAALARTQAQMGLTALSGPGLVITLDDSAERESPSGNLNDIVIHSQDVQAVANGLWAAGAEALAVNGQRVVPTSALLCVGNTLLINGTVHSPPYRFVALGTALRDPFLADPLVQAFAEDASQFSLGFDVQDSDTVEVPAFKGSTAVRYARADRPGPVNPKADRKSRRSRSR